VELRAQGLGTAVIAERLGLSNEAARTLSHAPRARSPHAAVRCAACGREVARQTGGGRRAPGDPLCLAYLAQRPGVPFPQQLLAYRTAAGLTQAALAAKAGLSQKVASQVKRDVGRPSEDTLRRLVEFLGPGRRGGDEPEAAP
jgi:hypothetical protein